MPARRATAALVVFIALAMALAIVGTLAGCSRHVPLSDVGPSGADVWARVTTSGGELVTGRLVSLTAGGVVVAQEYPVVGDYRLSDRGGERALYAGTERVPGELVRIGTRDGVRYAVVHRRFKALDVESATFHGSRGERSLASILSLIIGPVVGGALALVL